VIIVHKFIVKCNFIFFENTQGVCLRESVCVCVCVYLGLCVLDGVDVLCVSVCEDRQTLRQKQSFDSCL
jgi:hypothetical protein